MTAAADAIDAAAAILGDRAVRNGPLGPLTTYRVGGPAALLVEAVADEDLDAVAAARQATGLPVVVVGRGSNLLVADDGFPGIALTLGDGLAWIDVKGTEVHAGGATPLPVLARRTAAQGLTGLEWAVGVPGSVGGGVRMNAGGHGSDIAATLVSALLYDLDTGTATSVPAAGLNLRYRHSAVTASQVVTGATFALAPGDPARSEAAVAEIVRWRREHQPGGANCGSVFTNPPGQAAGKLVEEAGLRGYRQGSAFVSPKHANFIQVDDGGRAADVLALMALIRAQVEERTGVRLETEVQLVGFANSSLLSGG